MCCGKVFKSSVEAFGYKATRTVEITTSYFQKKEKDPGQPAAAALTPSYLEHVTRIRSE
jgi:hypothetical protein